MKTAETWFLGVLYLQSNY